MVLIRGIYFWHSYWKWHFLRTLFQTQHIAFWNVTNHFPNIIFLIFKCHILRNWIFSRFNTLCKSKELRSNPYGLEINNSIINQYLILKGHSNHFKCKWSRLSRSFMRERQTNVSNKVVLCSNKKRPTLRFVFCSKTYASSHFPSDATTTHSLHYTNALSTINLLPRTYMEDCFNVLLIRAWCLKRGSDNMPTRIEGGRCSMQLFQSWLCCCLEYQ